MFDGASEKCDCENRLATLDSLGVLCMVATLPDASLTYLIVVDVVLR